MSSASELLGNNSGMGAAAGTEQYLTFSLAHEEYGVDILRVQEIKGWTPVTRIPNAPEYLPGVLNLRGIIVPVLDLRLRFGLTHVEYTPTTVVIVVSVRGPKGELLIGLVVDGVSDVVTIGKNDVKPAPNFGTLVNTAFIHGLAATPKGMVMLLDIDRLFSAHELEAIDALSQR